MSTKIITQLSWDYFIVFSRIILQIFERQSLERLFKNLVLKIDIVFRHQNNRIQTKMLGVIMPLWNRMFGYIFGHFFYIEKRMKYEQIILLSSSRGFSLYPNGKLLLSSFIAFSLSPPAFSFFSFLHNSKSTRKKAAKLIMLNVFSMFFI